MSWTSRLKLFLGVIVVLGVVAGCTLVFTQRQSAAQSATATIEAETFTVGAVYAGSVVDRLVQPGQGARAPRRPALARPHPWRRRPRDAHRRPARRRARAVDRRGRVRDARREVLRVRRPAAPRRGHSWAAGLALFADGNNQESSSEAVAAWNGLALWAEASGDDELLGRAAWLLSNEAAAARTLWLEPTDLPAGYAHTIVSISWGAKRDDATWFSAEPSAILGIQALPLGPVSLEYLAGDPARVAENVADAGDTAFTGPLGDYVQAYSALGSPDAASAAATAFAARTTFDDGWSKALALAWVAAVQARSG